MARDVKTALLRGHVASDQGHRDVHIQQHATFQAVHVVMSLDTSIVSTRLIRERQLLNETVRRE
jgi:hypothetical protein